MHYLLLILLSMIPQMMIYANQVSTAAYFDKIRNQPQVLYDFLREMPKGGELHYHFSGGVYPEVILSLAQQQHYCLNRETLVLKSYAKQCEGVISSTFKRHGLWYIKTLQAWSFYHFNQEKAAAHDHFFATFGKLQDVFTDNRPAALAAILQRAASQHERYLEIMILPTRSPSYDNLPHDFDEKNLNDYHQKLLANPAFKKSLSDSEIEIQDILTTSKKILHCTANKPSPACQIKVSFQSYALREQNLDRVFIQLLHGFMLAQRSSHVVGVNLVQAEDGMISRRDYNKHMQLLNYLHAAYPSVHIALHAGELSAHTSSLEDRKTHIHDAIYAGHAERIGHGVDILAETDSKALFNHMAQKSIVAEVNLTSNRLILQVSGKAHPFPDYLKYHVPVVLSTDDEGIFRTSLTREYWIAVRYYHLSYATIKQISRNALTYNFLPGESLWMNAQAVIPVKECEQLNSNECKAWVRKSEKAALQWELEQDFQRFEQTLRA